MHRFWKALPVRANLAPRPTTLRPFAMITLIWKYLVGKKSSLSGRPNRTKPKCIRSLTHFKLGLNSNRPARGVPRCPLLSNWDDYPLPPSICDIDARFRWQLLGWAKSETNSRDSISAFAKLTLMAQSNCRELIALMAVKWFWHPPRKEEASFHAADSQEEEQ